MGDCRLGRGDPADTSLGSVAWAGHVVDGDLAYGLDGRDIPSSWSTGYVPLHRFRPFQQPLPDRQEGEVYTLNRALVLFLAKPDEST